MSGSHDPGRSRAMASLLVSFLSPTDYATTQQENKHDIAENKRQVQGHGEVKENPKKIRARQSQRQGKSTGPKTQGTLRSQDTGLLEVSFCLKQSNFNI